MAHDLPPISRWRLLLAALATCGLATPSSGAFAQSSLAGDSIRIARATSPIAIDGDLSEEAWRHATRIDVWYEVNPGDNVVPKIRNVGYLTYDDRYFYAAFEFDDPDPHAIRAPFTDRDNIGSGITDYGGVILDPRNTGRTAAFFVVNPHNIQYDSVTDDSSGEDASPDFFWSSATKIGPHGWTLEIRIPFSSLRYSKSDMQTWGIMLYRNYPRERAYQFYSARLPRGGNCLVCRENPLLGLAHLPSGGHLTMAPYLNAGQTATARDDLLGAPLVAGPAQVHLGGDVKYTPNATTVADLTIKPDFSQIESDTAQIATNQRFALFFPEKRPFFLEGVDLFRTPIQAVYTRTIAAPSWGGRITGTAFGGRYTTLVANDTEGGSVVVPGSNGSSLAAVDFGSTVVVARAQRDLGLSFAGLILTDREAHDGNGHNRVFGPDVQWRPSSADSIAAQFLYSDTRTPNRPDLADTWTGESFGGHAGAVQWSHGTTHLDWFGLYRDFSSGFRADSGFVPQVGFREAFGSTGWTFRPAGFLSRLRAFVNVDEKVDRSGGLLERDVEPGAGMDTRWGGFMQFRYVDDTALALGRPIERRQFGYIVQFSPSRQVTQIAVNGTLGQDIDFDNGRSGRGATVNASATLHPSDHLEFALIETDQWLRVTDPAGEPRRLFAARVHRVKTTYTFTSRFFVRSILQYVSTDRDPSLYLSEVSARDGTFNATTLIAYKINWQSVLFMGFGDDRELSDLQRLTPHDRQVFVKVSYAFQH